MTLEDLGYNPDLEIYRKEQDLDSFGVGRVVSEHKERYFVKTTEGDYEAEVIGNLRFSASSRSSFPAVGDWVAFSEYDESKVLIHSVFPRKSILERQSISQLGEKQIIAANIDVAFIVQAVDRDFNINRMERYLTICNASKVKPIIVLNKIDLIDDDELANLINAVQERVSQAEVLAISNLNQNGIDRLKERLEKGKTYCLLGSSGVGKSSLVNTLSGTQLMKTNAISASTNKGRHVTSHRELQVLETGGILIDNPGMREVGIADATDGLESTFATILEYAGHCRFADCTHIHEKGCAVLSAVENGEIDSDSYANFCKMEKEKMHFESNVQERRKKDKDFGKMIKNVKKHNKGNMNTY